MSREVHVRICERVGVRFPRATRLVLLTNGTKADAEAMRQEVADFLRDELKLTLSLEKTKVTHLNDGFAFLGFWVQRKVGHRGNRVTKVLIPPEAIRRFRGKILEATRGKTNDSVHTKILALDRIVGGWCRYYQYTTRASTVFNTLGHVVFKRMTLWLCAKYNISAPEAMRRFRHGNTLGTNRRTLRLPSDYRTQVYRESIRKPNPYTGRGPVGLHRETLCTVESTWTGFEAIKGQADRRERLLAEAARCCRCGSPLTSASAELDHIRPRKQFKRPEDAESFPNHQLLCHACHAQKTQSD